MDTFRSTHVCVHKYACVHVFTDTGNVHWQNPLRLLLFPDENVIPMCNYNAT